MHPLVNRACGAFVGLALLCGTHAAFANDLQTVRVVLAPLRDTPSATAYSRFDRALPAGEAFIVEVSIKNLPRQVDGDAFGTLDVWPRTNDKMACVAPTTDKQYHKLVLIASGEGDKAVLRAEVPPLQIGQEFCFSFDVRARPSLATIQQIATYAAKELAGKLLGDCIKNATDGAFQTALNNGVRNVKLNHAVTTESAARARVRYELDGAADSCKVLSTVLTNGDSLAQSNTDLKSKLNKSFEALGALDVPEGLQVPMFADAGVLRRIDELLVENPNDAKLAVAIQQLEGRQRDLSYARLHKLYGAWIALLKDFRDAVAKPDADKVALKAAVAEAKNKAQKIGAPELPEVFVQGKFILLKVIRDAAQNEANMPKGFKAVEVANQLSELLGGYGKNAENATRELKRWMVALLDIARIDKRIEEVIADTNENDKQVSAAEAEFTKKLVEALTIPDVRHDIEQNIGTISADYKLGKAKTPPIGNVAAIDFGAALAVPIDGPQLWVVPYAGINLYFTPIDRVIPISQLVGSTFCQVFSLTVGVTLTTPTLPGRTLKPIMFERYPLIGAGLRWNNYARFTAGAILYQIADRNPASIDTNLRGAPFISGSLDGDVIDLLNKAIGRK